MTVYIPSFAIYLFGIVVAVLAIIGFAAVVLNIGD